MRTCGDSPSDDYAAIEDKKLDPESLPPTQCNKHMCTSTIWQNSVCPLLLPFRPRDNVAQISKCGSFPLQISPPRPPPPSKIRSDLVPIPSTLQFRDIVGTRARRSTPEDRSRFQAGSEKLMTLADFQKWHRKCKDLLTLSLTFRPIFCYCNSYMLRNLASFPLPFPSLSLPPSSSSSWLFLEIGD